MPGLEVFRALSDALKQGYEVYDRIPYGYLVRKKNGAGAWQLAIVDLKPEPRILADPDECC